MKIYLVGGAVRDALLGLPPGDRDWVVVGSTQAEMEAQGFKAVGRDFPVFLHPRSGEEYALARTERKSGRGYRGFVVDADPSVTLEEDLQRRDFTINAIARDQDSGELVDPWGGVRDIQQRVLRHVGPAFVEDPLRVLRAARFLARFAPLGFTLAPETAALMRQIAESGELEALVPERIWQETRKALTCRQPSTFLRSLHDTGALAVILPELDALYGVPQRAEFHPEIDTGIHQEMVSDMAAQLAPGDDLIGFAALTHDLGKALTPAGQLPRHIMHEQRGLKPLAKLCERLKIPVDHRQLAEAVCREHLNVHRIDELRDATVLELISRCDGFRRPERIAQMALVCECDKRGRLGFEDSDYPQRSTLQRLHAAALAINARDIATEGLKGPAIGEALAKARIRAIGAAR
ncbi:2', 3'-cyclic nucleotide 2'-phosphodiesterase [Stenotrophomonas pictorum JCM 9942]|jgi:tRNA nucleotidyltransferase (CCA-adding enzyme)|uniref:Multifunctional CCA protein n=1 Tax=Stenotrophomonas pictorum JCM 9942 TaxID=1236960 RepID=A0A0R0AI85_9GAMM|nr:multifunctional CCA addition/repair protein [Stenotrophomonas pictorum]KRG44864.1 2', 3'-cyclic nucleotide 2'-phosphodiesterase [Stenotrophomonas pictorum JCM 9942]